jgi:hypothetical protein
MQLYICYCVYDVDIRFDFNTKHAVLKKEKHQAKISRVATAVDLSNKHCMPQLMINAQARISGLLARFQ